MTVWNFDMSTAPKSKPVKVTRKVKTAEGFVDREVEEIHPVSVLLATDDGKVYQSRWIQPRLTASGALLDGGRWSGFPVNAKSIEAWAHWPEHPGSPAQLHAAASEAFAHFHLEDCGSGQ